MTGYKMQLSQIDEEGKFEEEKGHRANLSNIDTGSMLGDKLESDKESSDSSALMYKSGSAVCEQSQKILTT